MQPWQQFYEMIGGAAATLLGLLFVSMSLNAETILGPGHEHSRRLAEQAFQNYLAVLVIALIAVFPGMAPDAVGYSLLWMSGIWGAWAIIRALPAISMRSRVWRNPVRRYLATLAGFAMLVWTGWDMIHTNTYRGEAVAIGAMLLLVSATLVSWDLLIRIAEEKFRGRGG
jgi:hypothetical protein